MRPNHAHPRLELKHPGAKQRRKLRSDTFRGGDFRDYRAIGSHSGPEHEIPEDDSEEQLEDVIDLARVFSEALSLALPDYPRAEGAELKTAEFAPPGVTPLTDEAARPFSVLAGLKDKLQ